MDGKNRYEELKEIQRRMAEEFGLDLRMDDCMTMAGGRELPPKEEEDLKKESGKIRETCDNRDTQDVKPYKILPPHTGSKRKVYFKECAIAGWNFYIDHEFWPELEEGTELALIRDRRNKHDRNAVAVALASDYDGNPYDFDLDFIIGYVPRTENEFIAQMMDLGWNDMFVAELTTVEDHGKYDDRLRMTIYIQSREGTDVENSRIHAMSMDIEKLNYLTDSLFNDGCVYFRWSGYPPWEKDLPHEGDKVLLIHQREENTILYLTCVMATGDQVTQYLPLAEDELNRVDDCTPYILTNILGPITIPNSTIDFLRKENISPLQPEGRLSEEATEALKSIFSEIV